MVGMTQFRALAVGSVLMAALAGCEREPVQPVEPIPRPSDPTGRTAPGIQEDGAVTGEVQAIRGDARDQLQEARSELNDAIRELGEAQLGLAEPRMGQARQDLEGAIDGALEKVRQATEKLDAALGDAGESPQEEGLGEDTF